jgi:hypothetical protein
MYKENEWGQVHNSDIILIAHTMVFHVMTLCSLQGALNMEYVPLKH